MESTCNIAADLISILMHLKQSDTGSLYHKIFCFYRTRVRSLVMLVSDSLTESLLFSKLAGLV